MRVYVVLLFFNRELLAQMHGTVFFSNILRVAHFIDRPENRRDFDLPARRVVNRQHEEDSNCIIFSASYHH